MALFLTTVTNTSMYTFEMAPVFSLMEGEVLSKMRELIGWQSGDGIFAPGGSISNLYGLLLARFKRFPGTKTKGITNLPQMALFCSEQVISTVACILASFSGSFTFAGSLINKK